MKKIAIGGGQGFWGDSNDAAVHLLRHGDIPVSYTHLPEDAAHAPPLFRPRSAAAGRRGADALFPLGGRGCRRAGRERSPWRPQTRFPGGPERSEKAGRYFCTGPPCKIFQISACGKAAASFFRALTARSGPRRYTA